VCIPQIFLFYKILKPVLIKLKYPTLPQCHNLASRRAQGNVSWNVNSPWLACCSNLVSSRLSLWTCSLENLSRDPGNLTSPWPLASWWRNKRPPPALLGLLPIVSGAGALNQTRVTAGPRNEGWSRLLQKKSCVTLLHISNATCFGLSTKSYHQEM